MLKKIILLFFFVSFPGIIFSQDASIIYKNTVNSTVTIVTDNGFGSGFFVSDNIIATNYHTIEGASIAYCIANNSSTKYIIDGYVAVDKYADLILLRVSGIKRPALKIATSNMITPGQKIYVIGTPKGLTATISDGIISSVRGGIENEHLIQITAPISPGSSGGPVLNTSGELIGIAFAQYTDGQNLNFAIPKSYLESLIRNKRINVMPITSLYTVKRKPDFNKKEMVLDIGIYRKDKPGLSLDYFANTGEYSMFFFSYIHSSNQRASEAIWMDNYRLVDMVNGDIYYAMGTDLPNEEGQSRVIYNNTKTTFCVWFNRLPGNVRRISLMEGDCSGNEFCFLDIDLNEYYEATDFDYDLYKDTPKEGTVTFYSNYGGSGDINVYIEDYHIGKLTSYFDGSYMPQCGENGTLSVRLREGVYNYTARDKKYNWKGQIKIKKDKCIKQGLSGM